MNLIVQKFGGVSMANPAMIQKTVRHVEKEKTLGNHVVVVVSAMAGVTDQLIGYIQDLSLVPAQREYHTVLTAGEQITAGLTALALQALGIKAQSFLSWQTPIETEDTPALAPLVKTVGTAALNQALSQGIVPVIAGFQGVTSQGSLVTLGRGGSDLSAVAVAASLGAQRCDLYKDVPGVMTADPKIVSGAQRISFLGYETMLELASLGSKVVQARSVVMAKRYKVPLCVCPLFENSPGTTIMAIENMEKNVPITSIVCSMEETLLSVNSKKMDCLKDIISALAMAQITPDVLTLDPQRGLHLTAPSADAQRAFMLAKDIVKTHHGSMDNTLIHMEEFAKISLVGYGMRQKTSLLDEILGVLGAKGISLRCLCVSEVRVTFLIEPSYAELATRLLHTHFDLDRERDHDLQHKVS